VGRGIRDTIGTRQIGYYEGVTTEERFERIETTLEAFGKGMLVVQQTLVVVMQSVERTQDLVGKLAETMTLYVEASDARMRQIEERLDALIRIIAAEHGNGKGKLP
jgi:hypothetical protein